VKMLVDIPKCIGSGQCALIAPDVFDQDDNGIVVVLREDPQDTPELREAAAVCPAAAIEFAAG
jgi:ferredoxin